MTLTENILVTLATALPTAVIMFLILGAFQAARFRRGLRQRTWILCYRPVGIGTGTRYAYCVLPEGHIGECATTAAQLELSGYHRPPF